MPAHYVTVHADGSISREPIEGPVTSLQDLILEDQSSFPEGHPCRDCDKLYREHPTESCEAWR